MLPIMPLCGSSPSISTLSGCPQTPSSYAQVPVNFCLSASQTYSQGQTTYMWQPRGPEWSVKFPIASPCIWSLSVSSNSCLKTLIILNFPQSVWKLLQENSELENFPEIFSHCFDPPRRKQPMDSLVTLDSPDLFHASLQCGDFYLRIMNSKRHYFHSFGKDKPLSSPNPWPHPQHLFLSGTQTMGFPE